MVMKMIRHCPEEELLTKYSDKKNPANVGFFLCAYSIFTGWFPKELMLWGLYSQLFMLVMEDSSI